LNLKRLTKRNKVKQDDEGTYLPNGQSAKSGLNKSWLDAAFGQFFKTLEYIAEKAGSVVIPQKPAYTSMILSYRNEIIFTDCGLRQYWDKQYSLMVDRDINAAINLKKLGLDIFPSIKRARRESFYSRNYRRQYREGNFAHPSSGCKDAYTNGDSLCWCRSMSHGLKIALNCQLSTVNGGTYASKPSPP
jgi:hypothetical protein